MQDAKFCSLREEDTSCAREGMVDW
uniref:Uncharacterized protein n=1 Tax=Arundo donax TaxID=35708 RepID=A0A0A9HAD0_ARUDO